VKIKLELLKSFKKSKEIKNNQIKSEEIRNKDIKSDFGGRSQKLEDR
jgi:hypothetical protein